MALEGPPPLLNARPLSVLLEDLRDERAADARADFCDLALVRYPHAGLSDRIWELRRNLTAYDAAFVTLAESLEVPLITCDAVLVGAPGHGARVELFNAKAPN